MGVPWVFQYSRDCNSRLSRVFATSCHPVLIGCGRGFVWPGRTFSALEPLAQGWVNTNFLCTLGAGKQACSRIRKSRCAPADDVSLSVLLTLSAVAAGPWLCWCYPHLPPCDRCRLDAWPTQTDAAGGSAPVGGAVAGVAAFQGATHHADSGRAVRGPIPAAAILCRGQVQRAQAQQGRSTHRFSCTTCWLSVAPTKAEPAAAGGAESARSSARFWRFEPAAQHWAAVSAGIPRLEAHRRAAVLDIYIDICACICIYVHLKNDQWGPGIQHACLLLCGSHPCIRKEVR